MANSKQHSATTSFVVNRKAKFEYEIIERLETGLQLFGSEVKAIREGKCSLAEAFCQFYGDELYLVQAHIAEYTQAHARNHEPLRRRKVLLHRRQLDRLFEQVQQQGLTLIPLSLYAKDHFIKLELGLCRGKKVHDKRASIKEREQKREMDRALRSARDSS